MQGPHLRKYGVSTTINFDLFEVDGVDFRIDAVHAAGDSQISKNEGAQANTAAAFLDEGDFYSLALTTTEMEAARIVIRLIDQTATKVWLDKSVSIETYGDVLAEHAFDLDLATQDVNVSSMDANTITATAINANAITSAKIAADAIGSTQLAANAIGASEIATGAITAAKFAANAIDSAAIATDAIGAGQIAANAIGASELATDAIGDDQIATGAIASTAFASGAIDAAAIAANAIGASEFAQGAADKVWSSTTRTITAFSTTLALSVWDVLETAILTASSIGLKLKNNLDVVLSTRMAEASIDTTAGAVDSVTTVATTTVNTDMRGTDSAALASVATEARLSELDDVAGKLVNQADIIQADTTTEIPATIATLQSDTDDIQLRLPGALVGGRIDSSVGAMEANTVTATAIATDAVGSSEFSQAAADKVWSSATRTLTAFSASLALTIWDVLESAILTASSIGLKLKNNLDVVLSTRMAEASIDTTGGAVDNVTLVDTTTANTDMRGTDSAALASVATEARLSELDDVAGKLVNQMDIVQTDTTVDIPATLAAQDSTLSNIQNRLPTVLIGGTRMNSSVEAMAANVLTDTAINAAALTAAKFAAGAIDENALATDAVNEIRDAILPPINTAFNDIEFLMVDATDGFTPETGLTVSGTRSINGGTFAAVTGTIAEVANGIYQIDASAADMNGKTIMFRFTATGAADRFVEVITGG